MALPSDLIDLLTEFARSRVEYLLARRGPFAKMKNPNLAGACAMFTVTLGAWVLAACATPTSEPAHPKASPVRETMLETEPTFVSPVAAADDAKGLAKRVCTDAKNQACTSCTAEGSPELRLGNFVAENDALIGLVGCAEVPQRTVRWNAATDQLEDLTRVDLRGCSQLHFPGRDLLLCPEQVKDSHGILVLQTYVLDLCAGRKDLLLEIVDSSFSTCVPDFQGPVRAIRGGSWQSAGNAVLWLLDVHETSQVKSWYPQECAKRATWESEEGYLAMAIAPSRPEALPFVLRDGRLVPTDQARALATSLGGTARSVQLRSLSECKKAAGEGAP